MEGLNNINHVQETVEDDSKTECYICWESNGTKENPIRRDCGCKGSMGFVHVQCLVHLMKSMDNAFLRPCKRCPQCLQAYDGPTLSALTNAMTFGWWKQQIGSFFVHIEAGLVGHFIFFTVIYYLGTFIDYLIEEWVYPFLKSKWDQSLADYDNNNFMSASMVQIAVVWFVLIGLSYRYWQQILSLSTLILLILCMYFWIAASWIITKVYMGIDDWIFVGLCLLTWFLCAAYRNRAEIRRDGLIVAMADRVLFVAALTIFFYFFVPESNGIKELRVSISCARDLWKQKHSLDEDDFKKCFPSIY